MLKQYKYRTITEDIKILIQYVQEQASDHLVVEATNMLSKAIKKGAAITIKEYRDTFDEEKQQYAEDSRTHEKPWELWEWQIMGNTTWSALLDNSVMWLQNHKYRRKQSTFMPEYYSGLNWRDAEHLIGKTVECTNNPDVGWKVGKLQIATRPGECFNVYIGIRQDLNDYYTYIRTCEETFKRPTINIGGVELPMPETVYPEPGTVYWVFGTPATAKHGSLYDSDVWPKYISKWEKESLKNGAIHLTEERAKAWADWWKKGVLAKIDETTS